jgi:8-oxo-dGTP diphosphatase
VTDHRSLTDPGPAVGGHPAAIATDAAGQRLVALTRADEEHLDGGAPCPLALVVVRDDEDRVLLGRNRWRGTFELPGGMRDGSEPARDAAQRELREETGLGAALSWVGIADFELVGPARRERAAVYSATADGEPHLADGELTELAWAAPDDPPPAGTSPLDWAIARWAVSASPA